MLSVTTWRLTRLGNEQAECRVTAREGYWDLEVREGRRITIAERCASDDAAMERATEIWRVLTEQGWTEPRH